MYLRGSLASLLLLVASSFSPSPWYSLRIALPRAELYLPAAFQIEDSSISEMPALEKDWQELESEESSIFQQCASFHMYNLVENLIHTSERLQLSNIESFAAHGYRINRPNSILASLSKAQRRTLLHDLGKIYHRKAYSTILKVKHTPTKSWLGRWLGSVKKPGLIESVKCQTMIEKRLSFYDIFDWLVNKDHREVQTEYSSMDLKLLAEIQVKKPGYVNILPNNGAGMSLIGDQSEHSSQHGIGTERLWVTGFSLTSQRGELHSLDVETGVMSTVGDETAKTIKWPNEVTSVPAQCLTQSKTLEDALLVTDGFLVPGKDKGGLYVVRNPGNEVSESKTSLTGVTDWFYHKAVWVDLTGDGRLSILAARAKCSVWGDTRSEGQLVWLERPKPYAYDGHTGAPLDKNGNRFDPFAAENAPWNER